MGLWFEHRDEKGNLIDCSRFRDGRVEMTSQVEIRSDGATCTAPSFSLKEAVALAKPTAHMPLQQREWALRVRFDDVAE